MLLGEGGPWCNGRSLRCNPDILGSNCGNYLSTYNGKVAYIYPSLDLILAGASSTCLSFFYALWKLQLSPCDLIFSCRFLLISSGIIYGYYAIILKVDEEDFGGHGALLQEGLFASLTLFLVFSIFFIFSLYKLDPCLFFSPVARSIVNAF